MEDEEGGRRWSVEGGRFVEGGERSRKDVRRREDDRRRGGREDDRGGGERLMV